MNKWPKHKNPSSDDRKATAPYSFVPLPDKVETVDPETIPGHDTYQPDLYTGYIEVKLTTASPLYVRCGWSPEDFDKYGKSSFDKLPPDIQQKVAQFFHTRHEDVPVIPGSSLRGMLRSMVEIVSYGKVQPVSKQKLFYRAVADRMTTLRESYQAQMQSVKAGYVERKHDEYFIRPAKTVGEMPFLNVTEKVLKRGNVKFISVFDDRYKPQYVNCWFKQSDKHQDSVGEVSSEKKPGYQEGVLVCSGPFGTKKRKHWIVPAANTNADLLPIPDETAQDYFDTLTEYQKQSPFNPRTGCLIEDRPIFYLEQSGVVIDFGPTRNFRVAYRESAGTSALSAQAFVPDALRNSEKTDFAEAIFGYVEHKETARPKALTGRVFVCDACLQKGNNHQNIWLAGTSAATITPNILSGPKPTTFAHYVTQKQPDYLQRRGRDGRKRGFLDLSHYAQPGKTVIRGHKLYWHKGENPLIEHPAPNSASDTQLTQVKPVKPGVSFIFIIHFENLAEIELGALLWVLNKGADENYRLRLGMGKPLGMGAVKTEPTLHLTNRQNRYQSLFNGEAWHLGQRDDSAIVAEEASQAFEAFIKENHKDAFGGDGRIEQLLALLSWPGPTPNETEYMDLDQFKQRKVLPTPKAVLEGKTQQNPAQSVSSKGERPTQRPVPQSTAAPDRPKRSQGSNLPQPGEVFTGIVFRILHTGTTFIELKKIAQDAGFARITEDQLGTRQYSVGNRAKCEVIEVNKVGDKWVVDCKPASKKKKK